MQGLCRLLLTTGGVGVQHSGSAPRAVMRWVRCKASAECPIQVRETRLSTKEEVRPYRPGSIVFSPEIPEGFASDKSLLSFVLLLILEVGGARLKGE